MSTDIEQYVYMCRNCEKFRRVNRREPLIPHKVPRLPYPVSSKRALIADNIPFTSYECQQLYNKYGITTTLSTCSSHHHRQKGLSDKAVGIRKKILLKNKSKGTGHRDLL
ncbi:hypothetical protein PR048_013219 [Dryococelus australis]|uniref:Uncharacterized protein n=1 Tax=Dryococelus australis TaxID=614101 RepID=A0ABQ9HSA3_9NEOP|nr:hypothetical protein PR048_013219 [Dryococelus australis]